MPATRTRRTSSWATPQPRQSMWLRPEGVNDESTTCARRLGTARSDLHHPLRRKPADLPPVSPGQSAPAPAAPFGVDYQGIQDEHSLLPRGWQRSGALAVLFGPALGALQAGLQIPTGLLSPSYGDPGKTTAHRTYQTIQGLSDRLGIKITSDFAEGQEH